MKRKRIDNYARDKLALIKADKKLTEQVLGGGYIDIKLMDEITRLTNIFKINGVKRPKR